MKRVFIGNGKVTKIISNNNDVILDHSKIEISDINSVNNSLGSIIDRNTVVINTAAKISLEWCEANKRDSYMTNASSPINLLDVCSSHGSKYVHISSGCIYDGNECAFNESMQPKPAAWYAMTKAWADAAIQNFGYDNYLIVRPRQLISPVPYSTNMLTKFLSYKEINCIDEQNSVTCIEDLGEMIDHLVNVGATGVYNCANTGTISPYEIALKLKQVNNSLVVNRVSYQDYLGSIAVKRVNTILDVKKLISSGYNPRNCNDALDWCISNYGIQK